MFRYKPSGEEKEGELEGTMGEMTESNNVTGSGWVREGGKESDRESWTAIKWHNWVFSSVTPPLLSAGTEQRWGLFVLLSAWMCVLSHKCVVSDWNLKRFLLQHFALHLRIIITSCHFCYHPLVMSFWVELSPFLSAFSSEYIISFI